MPREIVSKDGDMLDGLCWKHYGSERHVPAVLEANPFLTRCPSVLEAGLTIVLPDIEQPEEEQPVRLWS